mgnify:CR=1 FL=1
MLHVQRKLAAQILKCGENRIRFDPGSLEEIKEAITKTDVRALIGRGIISKRRQLNASRFWARKRKSQKSSSRQKGFGSRKGKKTARLDPKRNWMNKIRLQRNFIRSLKEGNLITTRDYHDLYMKSKGGFFRSIRHLKLYAQERGLVKNEKR